MKPLRCLSSVRFGSFLSYAPRGTSEDSAKAKRITLAIKNVRPGFIKIVVTRLRDEMQPGRRAAAVGERPKPLEHMRSMAVVNQTELDLQKITRVTLVDDVITRGATLIAGASLLQQRFPEAEIRVFALVRTKSYDVEVGKILEPIIGEVVFNGVAADRKDK